MHPSLTRLQQAVIGRDATIRTPFGTVPMVYTDWTASGRALSTVEDAVRAFLPFYGNTHSDASYVGRESTAARETARRRLRAFAGVADDPSYALILTGSGMTGALNRLVDILGLRLPAPSGTRYHLCTRIPSEEKPVILVGPYEHHSNLLPWRESYGEVREVALGDDGSMDLADLEAQCARVHREGRPLLVSCSAASNVTGVYTDVPTVVAIAKKHGALVFLDAAGWAPHRTMHTAAWDVDAIAFSSHKLPGGPGGVGVLVLKRALCVSEIPTQPGGGTVTCVTPEQHWYLHDLEHREESGTPDILGAIRAGMAAEQKRGIPEGLVEAYEDGLRARVLAAWQNTPGIRVVGNPALPSSPTFSTELAGPNGKPLHYNYVVALLNDLFGVQARGGCMCAGPYTQRLMDACPDGGCGGERPELLRPGWCRLSLSFASTEDDAMFAAEALKIIAQDGHRLLLDYEPHIDRGSWRYLGATRTDDVRSAKDVLERARAVLRAGAQNRSASSELRSWFLTPKDMETAR